MVGRNSRQSRLEQQKFFRYPKRKAKPPGPREKASFIEVLFVTWIMPLLKKGMQRELTEHDLYPTLYEDQSDHIGDQLEILWGDHVVKCFDKGKTPSLLKVLMKKYAKKFIFFGLFSLAEEVVFRMMQVIAIGYVLDYFEGNYLTTLTGTILFGVGGIILGSISFLVSFHWSIFSLHHVCTHIRLGLSSLVYRKILHLNQASMRNSTVGQIITMIAADLHRFDRKHIHVNYIWIAPIHLGVVVYFLYFHYNYGVISLSGICVLLIFAMAQYFMAKKFLHMRLKRVDSSDHRIRAVVEIINAFYTIKVHCWEQFFHDKAMHNRKQEIKFLRTTLFLKLLNTALGFIVTKMSVFMTLLFAFIFEDAGTIHSKQIFVTLILYEHIRVNFMILFPHAINDVAELVGSCRRISKFLLLDELENQIYTMEEMDKIMGTTDRPIGVKVNNLSCRWIKDDAFQLKDLNLEISKGELVVIAGPIASGKTTLISAVLGEIPPEFGNVLVVGRVAYVPQTPILFPGSVKRNIIFGYGYNQLWYKEVVSMCMLEMEFEKFPFGEESLTENTQLSTGQKAKICIARALYANADVYILDDPLQSMDLSHHRVILEAVILGALKDKAVLLVTHQIHFLEAATRIVLINEGQIQSTGTFKELVAQGIEFYRGMDDEFDVYEDPDDIEDQETMLRHDLTPQLIQPKDLRRRGSINFEVSPASHSLRVSQNPVLDSIGKKTTLANSRQSMDAGASEGGAITTISILAKDEDAYESEDRLQNSRKLSFGLYYNFLRAGCSRTTLYFLLLVCVISQSLYTATDIWLEEWAKDEEKKQSQKSMGETDPHWKDERLTQIIIYSVLILLIVSFSFGRSMLVYHICMKASTVVFEKLLNATIEARMYYFERTCAGHAINRLSKDMAIIDDLLPPTLLEALAVIFEIIGALCILAVANWLFIIPAALFIIANLIVYRIYHLSAADLKRMEGNARSPVYSHLSRTLQGVTTIRAFGQEQAFVMIFDRLQDNHNASWYLFQAAQSWLSVIIDCASVLLIGSITLSFFYMEKGNIISATVGLVISKMIELSILVQFAVSEISDTETQMISVERVLEYTLPKDTEVDKFENFIGPAPPDNWPSKGKIELVDLYLNPARKTRKELRKINMTIEGGETIGIVGKAGSGKSTLLNSLFRISEAQTGYIKIDGVDIRSLGLHNLRQRISMIPQNPCMFSGTVRENLDPLNEYTDEQIWNALQESTMRGAIERSNLGLDTPVTEYGMNFSAGQRQFICLARAILHKDNKILCCDEPTASLDGLSQVMLMCKLKEHFLNSTVLLVAHRINSIVDCDKVIVIEGGEVVEEGRPVDLFMKTTGPFSDLVKHLKPSDVKELVDIARDTQERKAKRMRASQSVSGVAKRKSSYYAASRRMLPKSD